jgi:hypothetical protein
MQYSIVYYFSPSKSIYSTGYLGHEWNKSIYSNGNPSSSHFENFFFSRVNLNGKV